MIALPEIERSTLYYATDGIAWKESLPIILAFCHGTRTAAILEQRRNLRR
jgi:hypothetical protein